EVDFLAERQAQGLDAVACLGDHREIGHAVQNQLEPVTNEDVIVGQQDACGQRNRHHCTTDPSGTTRRTVVPLWGSDSTRRVAPISSARSRIPTIPLPAGDPAGIPRPSSLTLRVRAPSLVSRAIRAVVASAWRTTFHIASCATR